MNNSINNVPYLRTTRKFPDEVQQLAIEVNKAYLDIANTVNNRTISIFPTNRSAQTGESWYLVQNKRQQGFRQIYKFTTTANINIGFKLSSISQITNAHGVYLSGTSYYGLIFADTVAITGQLSFYVAVNGASTTSDVITFVGTPTLTSGIIVLEWISEV